MLASALVFGFALLAGSIPQVIDLAAIADGPTITRELPRGLYEFRLANRAPNAVYRVFHDAGDDATAFLLLPTTDPEALRVFDKPPGCRPVYELRNEVLAADSEVQARERFGAFRELDTRADCPAFLSMEQQLQFRIEPRVGSAFLGDDLRSTVVVVERLDSQTRALVRRWRLVFRLPAPTDARAAWPYATETSWVVGQIASDLTGIALFARRQPGAPFPTESRVMPRSANSGPPAFDVELTIGPDLGLRETLEIREHLWSPADHAAVARALLKHLGLSPGRIEASGSVAAALTEPRAAAIANEGRRVSELLERSVLAPQSHEQAALVLGALALRESATSLDDTRHLLCRISTHLAMARALRGRAESSVDGQIAEALLTVLVGREVEARRLLDALERRAVNDRAVGAWVRALRVRNTGDWRLIPDDASATLLERFERFRAVRTRLGVNPALDALDRMPADSSADWGRMIMESGWSVEAGNMFAGVSVLRELEEFADGWVTLGGTRPQSPRAIADALNTPPGLCVGRDARGLLIPRALDRGTWANSYQIHVLSQADRSFDHYDRTLGAHERAKSFMSGMRPLVANLTLYPLLGGDWTVGTGAEGDPKQAPDEEADCRAAVDLLRTSPERVPFWQWQRVRSRCGSEYKRLGLPPDAEWFGRALPAGTLFDAPARVSREQMPQLDARFAESLRESAPSNKWIVDLYVAQSGLRDLSSQQVSTIYGPQADYDIDLMYDVARGKAADLDAFRRDLERIAALDGNYWLTLAAYLADLERATEAANAYEKGVAHARDRVRVSNEADWLVDHYFEHGDLERAKELARMAADVYSGMGLATMARLMERLSLYDEAEAWYRRLKDRYDGESLDRFYIRHERRVADGRFREQAKEAFSRIFPNGLETVTIESLPPMGTAEGLRATNPSYWQQVFGLRVGDIVVAADGFRVKNAAQYSCVRSFTDDTESSLIVWRDQRYQELRGRLYRWKFGAARHP